ncbi:tail protein X [Anaerocolumna sp. AGMB13025]|uniref:tail protein X n=1 Tax=Anaerocolumna sp. AGMB13025 TaxID=3039116 RepID=UPI00241C1A47|nr:tail protein X [Anaerocolumna sp. AGMB13025]WFR55352.1 tail protein X [Anaerocolumna sp. AGMB13025]
MSIYTTVQGDTWDLISYKVYGTSKHIGLLMQSNYNLLDTFIFSAGIEIMVPELTEEETDELPDWRK